MTIGTIQAEEYRDRLSDPDLPPSEYEKERREFFIDNEGHRNDAYDDGRRGGPSIDSLNKRGEKPAGNVTVGIGFNMDREGARREWNDAYKNAQEKPNFDRVYGGKEKLSDSQVDGLYKHSVSTREQELKNIYGEKWDKLSPNERLAIEDLYYNGGGKLVGKDSEFHKKIDAYIKAKERGDEEAAKKHLNDARWEVKHRSNKGNSAGIQKRRDAEEALLNTYKQPLQTPDDIVEKVKAKVDIVFADITVTDQEARQTANEISDQNRAKVSHSIKEKCGVDPDFEDESYLAEEIENFIQDYKEAVDGLLRDARQDIDDRIEEGRKAGETQAAMEKGIDGQLKNQEKIAERIGDNRVHQFYARLTQLRQQAVGINQYIWRSSDDDKVRPAHAAADDNIFPWDSGGPHPGEEENCRCSAEPVCPE